ncbi:hypothetical protein MSAN_02200800 [Mycena sanguinolenta]|uniref:Uncharacterized protein n=1 Tax=Mycena sanguinolenta TaxID=230812 RepID=A0A8H6XCZ1_9AGAR|nr:hypothetical protein MSAN_02200800 [Mycena sanguinolenta]
MPLPQELVDIILDNIIIAGDIPSLKSCALAARTFFHEILSSSPHVAPHVKELRIVLKGPNTFFAYNSPTTNAEECRGVRSFSADRALSLVLLRLVNLTRISLVGNTPQRWHGGAYSMNWGVMEEHLKSALAKLMSLFSDATGLKEMSLAHMHFTHFVRWQGSRPWRPRLRSLLINDAGSSPCCRYVVDPDICLSLVNTLTVATHSTEWRNKLIHATGVEHLHLMLWGDAECTPEIFSTKLRSIRIYSYYILVLLGAIFTMCPPNTSLERITVEGPGAVQFLRNGSEVDAIIEAKLDRLRALKTVELRRKKDSRDTFAEWEAAVQVALPSLLRRGMLLTTEIEAEYEWE